MGIEFQKTITSWKRWQRHTQMPIPRYRYTITKLSDYVNRFDFFLVFFRFAVVSVLPFVRSGTKTEIYIKINLLCGHNNSSSNNKNFGEELKTELKPKLGPPSWQPLQKISILSSSSSSHSQSCIISKLELIISPYQSRSLASAYSLFFVSSDIEKASRRWPPSFTDLLSFFKTI